MAALAPLSSLFLSERHRLSGSSPIPTSPATFARPGAEINILTRPEQDAEAALQALVDELGAPISEIPDNGRKPGIASGKPTPENLATTIAAALPEGAVVVDESVSYGRGFFKNSHAAAPHDWLQIMGGQSEPAFLSRPAQQSAFAPMARRNVGCWRYRLTAPRCTRSRACGRRFARSCR